MRCDFVQRTFSEGELVAIFDGGRTLLDDGRYRALVLEGEAAARWWGRGTRWCTICSEWFRDYRQYGELVYIEDCKAGRRWQLHLRSCELRNARNRRADAASFAKAHPPVIGALRDRIERDFRAALFFGLASQGQYVDHSLNLRDVPIKALPDGLTVRDDLDIRGTGLRALPAGLRVGGDFFTDLAPPARANGLSVTGRQTFGSGTKTDRRVRIA